MIADAMPAQGWNGCEELSCLREDGLVAIAKASEIVRDTGKASIAYVRRNMVRFIEWATRLADRSKSTLIEDSDWVDDAIAIGDGIAQLLKTFGVLASRGNKLCLQWLERREIKVIEPKVKQVDEVEKFELMRSPASDGRIEASWIVEQWNMAAAAAGMCQCRNLNKSRMQHAKARIADKWWRENYQKALEMLSSGEVRFAQGNNDRGWVGNIDWFLRPNTVAKIIENQHRGKKSIGEHVSDVLQKANETGRIGIWGTVKELTGGT